MQNSYVGDIGDFGKYGLLNHIFNNNQLKIGVNWYLVPDENTDGKIKQYLDDSKSKYVTDFKNCSPSLYKQLQQIICENKRSVNEVQKRGIFPSETIYYDRKLSFRDIEGTTIEAKDKRIEHRRQWVENGLKKLKECDVVFFDPDNGLEVKSHKNYSNKGIKYVFYDEIAPYYERGQSLIIYQHQTREKEEKYLERLKKIKDCLKETNEIFYMRFRRFRVRDYIFVVHNVHSQVIKSKIEEMLKSDWGKHFNPPQPIER